VLHRKVGDRVAIGEPLATVYYNAEAKAAQARQLIEASCEIAIVAPSTKRPLIHKVIGESGERN
jgi:thymidine phosphorylase